VTSSWFCSSTLNYDARSTTHQIYNIDSNIQVVVEVFSIMPAYFVQSSCACVLCFVQN